MEKTPLELHLRPAIQADARQIAALIHAPARFHRHLDWHTPLDWLGFPPFLVVEQAGRLVAALACPPDPPHVYWLRLFVHDESLSLNAAWQILWEAVYREVERAGENSVVVAIALQDWLVEVLQASNFRLRQHIVTLACEAPFPVTFEPIDNRIRIMTPADLEEVAELDALAFESIWQNSVDTLRRALQQAGIATVMEDAGRIIGYQISTRNPYGLHLARLAVRPDRQRQGLGFRLVADLLRRASARGVGRLTVNTQDNNLASLRLYQRLHFRFNGERYPVYEYRFGERREHGLA